MDCQEAVIERNGLQGIQLPVFRASYVSSLRHRLLAEAFSLARDIERYGTGFVRVREILQAYPEIALGVEEMGDFFKVELQQVAQVTPPITSPITHPITPPISGVDLIPVTDSERRILALLHDAPTLTGNKLAEDLGIGRGTMKEYLRRLKAKGVLVREGSTRTRQEITYSFDQQ